MTIREALLAMGYTESKPCIWLKPIGFQCFAYDEAKKKWSNNIRDMQGNVVVYDGSIFEDTKRNGDYLFQLKNIECFAHTGVYVDGKSRFELPVIDL